jgi:membrane-associated protein
VPQSTAGNWRCCASSGSSAQSAPATRSVAWVTGFTLCGYWFGTRPFIQKNFHYVIVAIIIISIMPAVIEIIRERRRVAAERRQAA